MGIASKIIQKRQDFQFMWNKKDYAIELRGLLLEQNQQLILGPLDWQIPLGSFNILYGPLSNAKSVLLAFLHGQLPATKGEGRILDFDLSHLDDLQRSAVRRRVALLSLKQPLLPQQKMQEQLDLLLLATDWSSKSQRQHRIDQLLHFFQLDALRFNPLGQLPPFQRLLYRLVRALLNHPQVLLLDEPTAELNEIDAQGFFKLLQAYASSQDCTVIYSTHRRPAKTKLAFELYYCEAGKIEKRLELPPNY